MAARFSFARYASRGGRRPSVFRLRATRRGAAGARPSSFKAPAYLSAGTFVYCISTRFWPVCGGSNFAVREPLPAIVAWIV
jgi:hypothetical protein